ncbi:MAG: sulfatase [Cyclobacteriaceae bacterium]|nr:sulfatase [Cyclobacteriaceae bacterium]
MRILRFPISFISLLLLFIFSCTTQKEGKLTPPNILFAIADDASYPHMGAYGCDWVRSPAFDRIANQGILFTNAYTPNAKCAPSRACILTGRNSWQLEEAANHVPFFPAKFKTYAESLAENNYHVGYTAKGWAPGVAVDNDGKPRQLTGVPYNTFKTTPPAKYISNNDYSANFEDFLSKRPEGKPFCFWYGSTEPHRAYEFRAGIEKGGKKLKDVDKVYDFWPDNDTVRTDLLDYAFEIEYFDRHLQNMLDLLEKNGDLDNTLIIVTADNGMPFPRIKGQEYELSNHLPLAIMWKNGIKNPGRIVDDFVNFIDFAPTYFELASLDPSETGMQSIQGQSLTDIFFTENSGTVTTYRDHVLIGKERHDIGRPHDWGYPIRGIVKDGFLLINNYEPERWPAGNPETGYLNCDGSPTKTVLLQRRTNSETFKYWDWSFGKKPPEELYKIDEDPECMNNLATNAEYTGLKNTLLTQMKKELIAQGDPRMAGNGQIYDEYIYAHEATRGFYERYMSGEKMKTGWVNNSDYEAGPLD